MIPSLGVELNKNPRLAKDVLASTAKTLKLEA